MAKERYPYPPDEFDLADRTNKPVGAHEQPRSTWSKVWPFLLVLVIVPAIAFGLIKFISDRSSVEPGTAPSQAATSTQPGTAQTPSAAPSETPSETPTAEPTYEVDKATSVRVLNASGISRQAANGAAKLTGDGWSAVTAGDYTGTEREGDNTVYYAKKNQIASAQAAAEVLGIDAVKRDADEAGDGITVVIRQALQ